MSDNSNQGSVNVEAREVQSWEQAIKSERNTAPYVDIYETQDDFVLLASLPGVSKENVKLKLQDGSLVIFGKVYEDTSVKKKYLLKETGYGNYYRKFNLSDSIDESKVEANYENGRLVVRLPKHDKVKPRTITIN